MSNVVIIESSSDYFQDLVSIVKDCKCNVQVASDYDSAVKIVLNSRVQIMILEWCQPSEDAQTMIQLIRNNHRSRRIHIIAISANRTQELVADALNSKVEDFFSWPVSLNEIRERLMWATNQQELLV
jgi:DNA-binding response OmpR family regulator